MPSPPPITLLQARILLAVSRHGSFTRAAIALHRTQPAITIQVRQLEGMLGVRLLDRTTRSLHLTPAGQEVVQVFASVLGEMDAMVERVQSLRAKRAGIVRLGCLPSVAASSLPPVIAAFRKKFPGIHFVVRDGLGDQVIRRVRDGEVEFGISDVIANQGDLVSVPLFEERMCAFFPVRHALQKAPRIDIETLVAQDLILMAPGSNARRVVDAAFAAAGRTATPTGEASYMSSAIGMVEAGLGVAVLPASGVNLRGSPRVRQRPIEAPNFTRHIALILVRDRTLSHAAGAFLEMLLSHFGVKAARSLLATSAALDSRGDYQV